MRTRLHILHAVYSVLSNSEIGCYLHFNPEKPMLGTQCLTVPVARGDVCDLIFFRTALCDIRLHVLYK